MNLRIDQLISLTKKFSNHSVSFGLRTMVVNPIMTHEHTVYSQQPIDGINPVGIKLRHLFNKIIVEIAQVRHLYLYDYDYDVWSAVNFDLSTQSVYTVMKDYLHPISELFSTFHSGDIHVSASIAFSV